MQKKEFGERRENFTFENKEFISQLKVIVG